MAACACFPVHYVYTGCMVETGSFCPKFIFYIPWRVTLHAKDSPRYLTLTITDGSVTPTAQLAVYMW